MAHIKHGKIYYNRKKVPGILSILLILLMETCFISIPAISAVFFRYNNYHDKRIIFLICLILLILTSKIRMKKTNVDYLVVFFSLAWMVIAVFSAISVSSIRMIIDQYYYYAIILLYFPLGKLFDSTDGLYESFLRMISFIGAVYAVYFIVAKLVYDSSGVVIFNQNIQHLQVRSGLRLARPCDFLCFSFLVTLCLIVKEKKNILYGRLLVIAICIYWVGQTRLYEILIVVLFLVHLIIYTNASLKIIVAVAVLASWNSIKSFYDFFVGSFSAKDTLSSTLARTQGYEIVKDNMFNHYIWGSGFDGKFQFSLGGWDYALSDLGIIGYFSVWGILGIVFIVNVAIRFSLNLRYIIQNQLKNYASETIFLAIWFAISSISVSFSDVQRIIYLPFMFLMIRQNTLVWKGEKMYEK